MHVKSKTMMRVMCAEVGRRREKRMNVNVNTTDATAGATALLLPAQNTHTLHDPTRDTEHARAGGVEDGLNVCVN